MFLCCICQKEISPHFAYLCKQCEEDYGLDPSDVASWPEWAKFCYSDERKQRYDDSVRDEYEIVFSDCPAAEILAYGEP